THAVYWPTMLMAAEVPLPRTIFAHGWWMMGEEKMSKSLGNVVRPLDLIDLVGVDPVRYYLLRDMVLGEDGNFTPEAFQRRYNSDLANDLGNLVNRVAKFIRRHFEGQVPRPVSPYSDHDRQLKTGAEAVVQRVPELISAMRLHEAVEVILELVRRVNTYLEQTQPWHQVKEHKDLTGNSLYHAAEALRIAAQLLHPVMPSRMDLVRRMIGATDIALADLSWGRLKPGTPLETGETPFPRLDKLEVAAQPEPAREPENIVTFDDFQKVDLRIAEVLAAEKVAGADKLLKLQISLGDEERQIIAGIAQHYEAQELVGRRIVVVANLQPAKIRGEESRGMLLAAEDQDGKLVLATVDDPNLPSGLKVG
ncbi:MAG: methionine--tRNA ligase subunit beta, partial [Fidelibacterota bacterium]